MEPHEIKEHWERSADTFTTDLRATTKTETIKRLEIAALERWLTMERAPTTLLEVGCGNGHNCIALAQALPGVTVTGVDYVERMVESATATAAASSVADRVRFVVGDATRITEMDDLEESYDAVFTVRCIINIPDSSSQRDAVVALGRKVCPGGHLLLAENVVQTHGRQNALREAVGLPARAPASFNRFLDDGEVRSWPGDAFTLVAVDDFAALHDLVLYVLVPLATGEIAYDHPLVDAATSLLLSTGAGEQLDGFPAVGQNRLYVFRKDG